MSVSPSSYPHPECIYENELFHKRLAERDDVGAHGYPDDLVSVMVFLATEASKYITGVNIMVDGGQTAW